MSAYKHIQDRIYYTYIVGTKCLQKKKKNKTLFMTNGRQKPMLD